MAKLLEMPKLSPTMEEGRIATWHKKEGDEIAVDDLLAEVETDKATMEFRSFDKGTLLKTLVPAGAQVKLGQPVAVIGAPGEDLSALGLPDAKAAVALPDAKASPDAGPGTATAPPPETAPPPALRRPPVVNALERTAFAPEPEGNGGSAGTRVLASPYVRKVAREMGIDLQGAHGSGPRGRVEPGDLEAIRGSTALARTTLVSPTAGRDASLQEPEVRALSPMRKTIARRLTEAKQTVPHFYLSTDVDAGELANLRERINAELASHDGAANGDAPTLKVSFNDLLIKACSVALTRVPECNASYTPEAILVHKRVDMSVAVA